MQLIEADLQLIMIMFLENLIGEINYKDWIISKEKDGSRKSCS